MVGRCSIGAPSSGSARFPSYRKQRSADRQARELLGNVELRELGGSHSEEIAGRDAGAPRSGGQPIVVTPKP